MTRKQDSPETPAEAARRHGMALTHLLIVSDIERSVRFYRDVLGATVARRGEPSILRLGQGWLILNVGGGPTPDKPDVTMTPPDGSANVTSALNIRVADLAAVYRAWSDRGARFLTEPVDFGWEIRCYLRDPDGHLIEVGQTAAALSRPAGQPVPVRSRTLHSRWRRVGLQVQGHTRLRHGQIPCAFAAIVRQRTDGAGSPAVSRIGH